MSKIQFRAGGQMYKAEIGDSKIPYGGMATPFGIRIYTAIAHAGVTDLQMFITGVIYSSMLFACAYAVGYLQTVSGVTIDAYIKSLAIFALYLILFRLTPIASIHASEHQIIHAMENEADLTSESVKSQNRVHPRCGTNLMALFLMFGLFANLIGMIPVASWVHIIIMIPVFVLSSWASTSVGGFLQKHLTTKTARDKDIDKAIEVGIEHNTRFVNYAWKYGVPSPFNRFIMNLEHGGIIYMLLSYFAMYLLLSALFPIPGH